MTSSIQPPCDHTILFEWDFSEFRQYVSNCEFEDTIQLALKYIPADALILEAGCGAGHVIEYLQQHKYNIEGIELNAPVVEEIKTRLPHLRVEVGDVSALKCENNTYGGLLSFGVVEHFRAGLQPPLREHFRVLKSGGIAVISVPSFNLLRRYKYFLRNILRPLRPRNFPIWRKSQPPVNYRGQKGLLYHAMPRQGNFFEYWLKPKEFEKEVLDAGFEIVASLPTHHYTGLWSDLGEFWARNDTRRFTPTVLGLCFDKIMRHWPFFHNFMHTIIAKKP
jgi:SAM-dependent methyltransferase